MTYIRLDLLEKIRILREQLAKKVEKILLKLREEFLTRNFRMSTFWVHLNLILMKGLKKRFKWTYNKVLKSRWRIIKSFKRDQKFMKKAAILDQILNTSNKKVIFVKNMKSATLVLPSSLTFLRVLTLDNRTKRKSFLSESLI